MKLSGVQQFCSVLQIVYNTSNPSYGVGSFSSTNVTILEDHRCFLTAAGNYTSVEYTEESSETISKDTMFLFGH
jgi:hypothetical protein